jgi:hypothetical protein
MNQEMADHLILLGPAPFCILRQKAGIFFISASEFEEFCPRYAAVPSTAQGWFCSRPGSTRESWPSAPHSEGPHVNRSQMTSSPWGKSSAAHVQCEVTDRLEMRQVLEFRPISAPFQAQRLANRSRTQPTRMRGVPIDLAHRIQHNNVERQTKVVPALPAGCIRDNLARCVQIQRLPPLR